MQKMCLCLRKRKQSIYAILSDPLYPGSTDGKTEKVLTFGTFDVHYNNPDLVPEKAIVYVPVQCPAMQKSPMYRGLSGKSYLAGTRWSCCCGL